MKKISYLLLSFPALCCLADSVEHELFWSPGFNISLRSSSIHDTASATSISGFRNPIDATSDGEKVYFTNGGSLYSLDLGSTDATELFRFSDHSISPNSITVYDGDLFVADGTKIYKSQLSNVAFQTIVENPDGYISDIVTDGVDLFWADEENGIYRAPTAGGSRVMVVVSAGSPLSLTIFQDTIFWTEDGTQQIRKVNKNGSSDTLILDLDSELGNANYLPQSISIAANRIWWSDVSQDEIYSCRLDGSNLNEVSLPVFSPSGLAWVFPNTETGELGIGPLEAKRISVEENGIRISWNAMTGRIYGVLSSEDLNFSDPPFASIQDFEVFHHEILLNADRQFYKISEE